MAPFLCMGFNCLKATATSRRQFTFYHSVPRNSWYSFYRPRKDERLSRPWSHPVVLNTETLDWESSALTTRPSLFSTDKTKLDGIRSKIKWKIHVFWYIVFQVLKLLLIKKYKTKLVYQFLYFLLFYVTLAFT